MYVNCLKQNVSEIYYLGTKGQI